MIPGETLTMRARGPRTQAPYPGPAHLSPAHLGPHPGDIPTKVLPPVFPSVRDPAKSLETPFQLSAYPKNGLTVQRRKPIDG